MGDCSTLSIIAVWLIKISGLKLVWHHPLAQQAPQCPQQTGFTPRIFTDQGSRLLQGNGEVIDAAKA